MDKSAFLARVQRPRKVEPVTITGLENPHVRMLNLGERERLEKALFGVAADEARVNQTLLVFGLCDASGTPFLKESEYDALEVLDVDEAKAAKEVFLSLNKLKKEDEEEVVKNS